MRPARRFRTAWWLAALLLWAVPGARAEPSAPAPPPAPASAQADDPERALQRALDLERKYDWTAAVEAYEGALKLWPARKDFERRLRLCESHYRLGRRYQDPSFRRVLLALPKAKAVELYEEVLERIDTQYVDPVALGPMVRTGYDNLEVALRDPAFLKVHAPGAAPERIRWLRDAFRARRNRLNVHTRADASAEALAACDLGRQALGLGPAAVLLEFTFGACDALPDDYSSYLTPDKLDDLYAMIDGNFVGLGIELKLDDQGLKLVGVIRGGPAWEAGLTPGDRITHVAGQPMRGLGLDEAAGKLQGAEGTAVEIVVLRADGSTARLVLTRRPVEVESVPKSGIVDEPNGVGYIQLTGFQKSSVEELDRAITSLTRRGMRYLVLDLRGNPGGLLNVAVEMADRFLESGVIVSTRGRAPGQSATYKAHAKPSWTMPMAVLVDHDSASASEILAGALKDHRRATIIGERSFGKGSVQSIFSLRAAPAGLKLTTAKFYSPRNAPYSEQGVEPDLPVHVVARPPAGADEPLPSLTFGDPTRDPVLDAALRQARRQLTAAAQR